MLQVALHPAQLMLSPLCSLALRPHGLGNLRNHICKHAGVDPVDKEEVRCKTAGYHMYRNVRQHGLTLGARAEHAGG